MISLNDELDDILVLNLPTALLNLPANCGVYTLWILLQHHGIDKNIPELAHLCQHDCTDGTFTIALAVALKKLGFELSFHTAPDPNISAKERLIYTEAQQLKIPLKRALRYQDIQHAVEQGHFVIVFYDNLIGVGNQSLIYSIDQHQICFFDSFEPMSAKVFERQRKAEGICQQAIIIDDRNFQMQSVRM